MPGFRGIRGWVLIAGAVLALALAAPSLAAADTITVTTNLDTSADHCTLRDAISAANTAATAGVCVYGTGGTPADPDTIDFNLPALPATITLATALPHVFYPLTIAGPGASQLNVHRDDAAPNFRILWIDPNGLQDQDVISGLTLSNGKLVDSVGAGIVTRDSDLTLDHVVVTGNHAGVNFPGGSGGQGGGIFVNNDATLHVIGSTVSDNHVAVVAAGGAGGLAQGGGIDDEGTMTMVDSTVSGNDATATASGGNLAVADGGGIISNAATIKRSTISGNAVTSITVSGPSSTGGAGLDSSGSSLDLELSTIGGNTATSTTSGTADAEGGGLYVNTPGAVLTGDTIAFNTGAVSANFASATAPPDTTSVRDTIVSNPTGGLNCSLPATGTISSLGFNVEDDGGGSCHFIAAHDLSPGTNPMLNPVLALNTGTTENYALQTGSPAIEAGSAFGEATDQRGLLRPSDDLAVATAPGSDGSDIGTFEVQGQPFAAPPPPPPSTPAAPVPTKKCKKKKHGHKASAAKKKKCKKKRK